MPRPWQSSMSGILSSLSLFFFLSFVLFFGHTLNMRKFPWLGIGPMLQWWQRHPYPLGHQGTLLSSLDEQGWRRRESSSPLISKTSPFKIWVKKLEMHPIEKALNISGFFLCTLSILSWEKEEQICKYLSWIRKPYLKLTSAKTHQWIAA